MMNKIAIIDSTSTVVRLNINDELFKRWTCYIDAKPRTIETYSKSIKQFFIYLNENGIKYPQREDIVAYRDSLKDSGHKPTTIQNYLATVKLFFQWTEREGIYPNIADRVKGAKLDIGHKKDYLTTNQVNKLLKNIDRSTIKGLRDYAILSLMVTTGLRTVSIIRANIEDIRVSGDSVVLHYQGKGHEEKTDYVKLAEPVEEAIRVYLKARGIMDDKEPLFGSLSNRNNNNRMTTRSISRIIKQILVSSGLDSNRLTAHSLRHTAATLNLLNGGTPEETQQLLGHTSINTTLIYSHALDRAKNNSESRIASTIFK